MLLFSEDMASCELYLQYIYVDMVNCKKISKNQTINRLLYI